MSKIGTHTRAVVTGAGSGIGRAFAIEIASRGGNVVCSDVDFAAARQTLNLVRDVGGGGLAVPCDVSDLTAVESVAERASEMWNDAPNLVVNNAGIGTGGRLVGDTSIDDWEATLAVNLWGVIHGCHVFVPMLRAGGSGGIINVASAASFGAAPRMAAYNVSKAGVLSLSETLAAELAGTGVNVTVVCPTFVKTNILESKRITAESATAAEKLMQYTGISPRRVARDALRANRRGQLYAIPNFDAKVGWQIKRTAPAAYTRALGLLDRLAPIGDSAVSVIESTR